MFTTLVYADSQRIVEYEYDGAGNIIGVRSGRNLGPPDVTSLEPAFVNQGSSNFVTATGVNLFRAEVMTTSPGLSISNVFTAETRVTFRVSTNATATIGLADISFTTRLGTDIEQIAVAERTPVISTEPNPIVLAPDNQPVLVNLVFDQPFSTDQIYDVLITDDSIAVVDRTTVTLLAGETEVSVNVTGLVAGNTTLEINQLSNFQALGIPVIVNVNELPAGNFTFYTKPVGVAVFVDQDIQVNGIFTTQPVGVAAFIDQQIQTNSIFVTQPVGTSLGAAVDQINPANITAGTSATLVLTGFELDSVTAVSFIPSDGITQTGGFVASPDGSQLDIPVSISGTAATGTRIIQLTTPQGNVLISQPLIIE